jgi:hypothetical protein
MDAAGGVIIGNHATALSVTSLACPLGSTVAVATQNGNHATPLISDSAGRWSFGVFFNGSTKNTCQSISFALDDGTTQVLTLKIA